MTATSAFITSLSTSFLVFAVLYVVYIILSRRPGNFNVYFPLRALRGESALTGKRGPFQWAVEAYRATDEELVAVAGLDAFVYIQLFTTALEIIVYSAIFCLPVLIPLAVTSDNNVFSTRTVPNYTYSDFDNLGMGNIRAESKRIWAFLIGVYWVTFVSFYSLWKAYLKIFKLRNTIHSSLVARPQQYAVLVRDIPTFEKHETRTEQIDSFFRRVHPGSYESCMVIRKLNKAQKLFTKLETAQRKLEHAEAVFELSKSKSGVRPMHKTGTFGLVGPKVDSITHWTEKIRELTTELEEEKKRVLADTNEDAALVFFNDRLAAAEAAQTVHSPYALQWQVELAPEPRECIWSNLHLPAWQRSIRRSVVYIITFLTIVFYMIPIAAISALTTLENLEKLVPFIKTILDIKVLKAILQAYLPQLALIIFLALLPMLLLALSKAEGIPSESHIARAASGKYFYFMVFNVFLGITVFGSVISSIDGFKDLKNRGDLSVGNVVDLLGSKLPPVATYFITYVALKFFIGYGLTLSRLVPLIIYHLKRKFLCKTERELQEAWAPGPFTYHTAVPGDLLIVTVMLCYSVIAPMILVFAFLYFFIGWLTTRNAALNVQIPDWESNGRMWPHISNRFLGALLVSQLTALGYFAVKKFPYTILLIFLPIATYAFYEYCKRNFYPSFAVVSLYVASKPVKETPSPASVVEAYTPTCLLDSDKFEDANFQDARSNMTSRSNSGITSPAERTV